MHFTPADVALVRETFRSRALDAAAEVARRRAAVNAALPEIAAYLAGLGATRVWLFGSFGWGPPSADSDGDLAVQGLPTEAHFRAWDAVDDLLARHGAPAADLVRLEDAPPLPQARILADPVELRAA